MTELRKRMIESLKKNSVVPSYQTPRCTFISSEALKLALGLYIATPFIFSALALAIERIVGATARALRYRIYPVPDYVLRADLCANQTTLRI